LARNKKLPLHKPKLAYGLIIAQNMTVVNARGKVGNVNGVCPAQRTLQSQFPFLLKRTKIFPNFVFTWIHF